ncbi:TPA: hypothetical protein RTG66_001741 [Campylobacter jejuni]|nr:hypothetical protein [Campylobacter jejuni]
MLEYFNCYVSKKENYNYEKLKQELKENGLNDKDKSKTLNSKELLNESSKKDL